MSREKTCYCHRCDKWFHPLGIMRHRAMHRDKHEFTTITFSNGKQYTYDY